MIYIIHIALVVSQLILTIDDVKSDIIYEDNKTHFFLGIDNSRYTWGIPLLNNEKHENDMPQSSGILVNCTNVLYKCKSFSVIKILIPKKSNNSRNVQYATRIGNYYVKFSLKKDRSVYAFVSCYNVNEKGCGKKTSGSHPRITYSYGINSTGKLKFINIEFRDSSGYVVQRQNMLLKTKDALTI